MMMKAVNSTTSNVMIMITLLSEMSRDSSVSAIFLSVGLCKIIVETFMICVTKVWLFC